MEPSKNEIYLTLLKKKEEELKKKRELYFKLFNKKEEDFDKDDILLISEMISDVNELCDSIIALLGPDWKPTFLIGNTGSGKTTFLNYQIGKQFIGRRAKNGTKLECTEQCDYQMGATAESMTFLPNVWFDEVHKIVYIDCPGFVDTSLAKRFVNAFLIDRLLSAPFPFTLLLLCAKPDFCSARADVAKAAIDTLEGMFGLFCSQCGENLVLLDKNLSCPRCKRECFKYCNKCNKKFFISERSGPFKYCPKCGKENDWIKKQEKEPDEFFDNMLCSNCKENLRVPSGTFNFCKFCGKELKGIEEESQENNEQLKFNWHDSLGFILTRASKNTRAIECLSFLEGMSSIPASVLYLLNEPHRIFSFPKPEVGESVAFNKEGIVNFILHGSSTVNMPHRPFIDSKGQNLALGFQMQRLEDEQNLIRDFISTVNNEANKTTSLQVINDYINALSGLLEVFILGRDEIIKACEPLQNISPLFKEHIIKLKELNKNDDFFTKLSSINKASVKFGEFCKQPFEEKKFILEQCINNLKVKKELLKELEDTKIALSKKKQIEQENAANAKKLSEEEKKNADLEKEKEQLSVKIEQQQQLINDFSELSNNGIGEMITKSVQNDAELSKGFWASFGSILKDGFNKVVDAGKFVVNKVSGFFDDVTDLLKKYEKFKRFYDKIWPNPPF